MVKINKYVSIAAILILVLCLGTVFLPAHKALAASPIYVNVATGDDGWDGTQPTGGDPHGPKQTIGAGFDAVDTGGTVNVAAGTYPEYALYFNKSFTLAGAGAAATIIDGGGSGGVILVVTDNVTISGMTIQNGNAGTATGGLCITGAVTVTVNDCVIKDNVGRNGGGVGTENGATLNMNRCTISGNSAPSWGFSGGGIENASSTVNLTNCTISGNSDNSTGNGYGGGIANTGTGTMTLTNCTVVNNTNTGTPGYGGGFFNGSNGTMTFKNTIVANNTATGGGNNGYNDGGTVTSLGCNIDSEDSCGFHESTDKTTTNPLLGPLADNGGPSFTHALLSGSPAIDAGTCTGAPTTDQRGIARPQGAACDIGAYEGGLPNIPDVVDDYAIKGSIKFYDWKCNKWIIVQSGTLHITEQSGHKIKGYFEPGIAIDGWPASDNVDGYVGPFVRDAKGKIKNTPRLSLMAELGTYCDYPDEKYVTYIINGKVKWDKKLDTVKSIKCTINGWGEFSTAFPDVGGPSQGQFEGKFTATPMP